MSSRTTVRVVTTDVGRGRCPIPYPRKSIPHAQSHVPRSDKVTRNTRGATAMSLICATTLHRPLRLGRKDYLHIFRLLRVLAYMIQQNQLCQGTMRTWKRSSHLYNLSNPKYHAMRVNPDSLKSLWGANHQTLSYWLPPESLHSM
jgi:hypothetical protein